eukprot:4630896-Pleurochrysis_carterae.AAC.2
MHKNIESASDQIVAASLAAAPPCMPRSRLHAGIGNALYLKGQSPLLRVLARSEHCPLRV